MAQILGKSELNFYKYFTATDFTFWIRREGGGLEPQPPLALAHEKNICILEGGEEGFRNSGNSYFACVKYYIVIP